MRGKGFDEVECVLLQRLLIALDVTLTECQGDLNRLNEDGTRRAEDPTSKTRHHSLLQ